MFFKAKKEWAAKKRRADILFHDPDITRYHKIELSNNYNLFILELDIEVKFDDSYTSLHRFMFSSADDALQFLAEETYYKSRLLLFLVDTIKLKIFSIKC